MQPVGPSAVPAVGEVFTPTGPKPAPLPRALETAEVPEHARSYAEAARRAIDAGFDGVELHGAYDYLISQFLSSNANLRADQYGGSVTNRIRFAVEAVSATVETVGAARTGIRLSPASGFWGAEETDVPQLYTELLTELARLGLAYVHLGATTDEEILVALRRAWPGTLIMSPAFPMGPKQTGQAEADHWLGLGAELINFGRALWRLGARRAARVRLGRSAGMALDWDRIGAGDSEAIQGPRDIYAGLANRPWVCLRHEQGEVLDEWFDHRRNDRDVVITQNTGGGKTAVGLLIAQSTLNEGIGKAVYLAPDK